MAGPKKNSMDVIHSSQNETSAPKIMLKSDASIHMPYIGVLKQQICAQEMMCEPEPPGRCDADLEKEKSWTSRASAIPVLWKTPQRADIRYWCMLAVAVSWILSLLAIGLGAQICSHVQPLPAFLRSKWIRKGILDIPFTPKTHFYLPKHFAFPAPKISAFFVLLIMNVIITALLDAHSRIHSTVLRWIRIGEGKGLKYNTNSALFSSTCAFSPCHWTSNILAGASMFICYGAASFIMANLEIESEHSPGTRTPSNTFEGPGYGLDISGVPLVMFGVALCVRNSTSTWSLFYYQDSIKTWSSDPVVTAGFVAESMVMEDRKDELQPENNTELHKKLSAHQQVKELCYLERGLWTMFMIAIAAILALIVVDVKQRLLSMAYVEEQENTTGTSHVWQMFGTPMVLFGPSGATGDWAGVLVQSGMQGLLTTGLHCADVVMSFLNDEDSWQRATTLHFASLGAKPFQSTVQLLKWRTLLLFVLKAVAQWVFGSIFSFDVYFTAALLPMLAETGVVLVIVVWVAIMVRKKPTTQAPTTYGDIKCLKSLIRNIETSGSY